MAREIGADVLLGLAVIVAVASATGVLVMRDAYQKLHYVTPLSLVSTTLVGLAVLVQSGLSTNSAQTWLTVLFVAVASPFVSHATMRAAKVRADGDWRLPAEPGAQPGARER
jgi:multisubunit Na+/H+ antiporter MnhG subunit